MANDGGVSLTQRIYHYLWHEIYHLHLEPGTKLSEARLARQFECSRVPVREAVQRLAAEDALELQPQRGSFVTRIELRELEHIRYVREALEYKIIMEGFRAGCFAASVPYLEFLTAKQEELMRASAYELAFELDQEFHKVFYTATDKEFALEYTGERNIHYMRARFLAVRFERPFTVPDQHRVILAAIKDGDETALASAISTHMNNVNAFFAADLGEKERFIRRT